MAEFESLVKVLSGHKVFIQTHDYPDPDAIASACGLQELLKWKGIETDIVYFGSIDKINTKMLVDVFDVPIRNAEDGVASCPEDYVITIDGQKNNSNFTDLLGNEVACIDHHPWSTEYRYPFVKHQLCGACATIITKWIEDSEMPISMELATLLLYGIKMDTRNFMTGVTKADIMAFAFLNDFADNSLIYHLDNSVLELPDLRAYGAAIENVTLYNEVGFAYIPFECPDGLIASIAEFILSISNVSIAIVYAKRYGGLKLSMRSETEQIHCGAIICEALSNLGSGGGHPTMAGGFIPMDSFAQMGNQEQFSHTINDRFVHVIEKYHLGDS